MRLFTLLFIFVVASPLHAQTYPAKPVKLLQGFAAGGNADTIARVVAQGLSQELGQQVIVEGKTGAGGNIASEFVAKSPADGYTLILLTGGHAVSAAVYNKLPFEPLKDFTWVSLINTFPFVIGTAANSPIDSVQELIEAAKKQPGKLTFSSVGIGTTQHLIGELLQVAAGVKMLHVPYRGGGAPAQDVIAGRVDLLFDSVTVARGRIEGGQIKGLGVTSVARIPQLPNVPPVAETVPGFEVMSWTGIAGPAGLPAPVVSRLNAALVKVVADAQVQKRLVELGSMPGSTAPAETERFVAGQIDKWRKVVEQASIPKQ